MLHWRKILSLALVVLSFSLLGRPMTGEPGVTPSTPLAYVGLWVGAAVAIILALWVATTENTRKP
jgi:high-affinity Fe2+/Pb2+ permease